MAKAKIKPEVANDQRLTTNDFPDERRGLPSISGLERLSKCPGSWTLTQFVQALYQAKERKINDAAASGTRIHSALSGEDAELSRYENWTKERCEQYEVQVLAQLKEQYGFTPDEEHREVRAELRDKNGKVIATGRDDVTYICHALNAALVIDYKTGTIGAGNVELNLQLTGYAVLAFQRFIELATIFVSLIQPNAPEKVSIAILTAEDCKRAEAGIIAIIEKGTSGTTERHADIESHCKYCPAKAFCPEFLDAAQREVNSIEIVPIVTDKDKIALAIYEAPIEKVILLYERRGILTTINEAVAGRMKRQLANAPESVPGYELGSSGSLRMIPDLPAAFAKIKDICTHAEFDTLLKMSVPELEVFHKEKSKLKGKACEDDFAVRFGGLIVSTLKEPTIRKKKKEIA